jgi:hypothetical protein
VVLYFAASAPCLLLGQTYFWDDWYTYFSGDFEVIKRLNIFSGFNPIRPFIEYPLIELGPQSFRIFTVFAFLICGLMLAKIIRKYSILDMTISETTVFTSVFLLVPANGARWSLTTIGYTISLVSFLLAWFFLSKRTTLGAILSIPFFIYSYDTASLASFVLVPVLLEYIESRRNHDGYGRWLLPLVFISSPGYMIWDYFVNPNIDPVRQSYYTPTVGGLARMGLVIVSVTCLASWIWVRTSNTVQRNRSIVSCLMILLGTIPYLSLGHFANPSDWIIGFIPGYSDWDSRHQLLMPFGIAMAAVSIRPRASLKQLSYQILILSLAFISFATNSNYLVDSIKQRTILTQFKDLDLSGTSILYIQDNSTHLNARGRWIRDFEWSGLVYRATGNVTKIQVVGVGECLSVETGASLLRISGGKGKFGTILSRSAGLKVELIKNCGTFGVRPESAPDNLFTNSITSLP